MTGSDNVITASSAGDFLNQIYEAEAQGKRIVITDAQSTGVDGQLGGFSVSWKPQSKAARVFQNILSFGSYGRDQDQRVIVALKALAHASFGAEPTHEPHVRILRDLTGGEAIKHKNNVVSSFIKKLELTADDFAPLPEPVAPHAPQLSEFQRQVLRRQEELIQRRENLEVAIEWVYRGFDREAVSKAYRDNPNADLTPELIKAAAQELYGEHPAWQNYLKNGDPKPVKEKGVYVDYYADPNSHGQGFVAGFDLTNAASAQNVGKVQQALGNPEWVNEQVRQIAEETGKGVGFKVRDDEFSGIRKYIKQKLIEHLPKDPNKPVDAAWVRAEFRTQFLKAWERGEDDSAFRAVDRDSAYSDRFRAKAHAFTERYAKSASEQLDNIIANRTNTKPQHRGPGNADLEPLLNRALGKAQLRFGVTITDAHLAEPKFRADFLKAVRHEIKHRELTGNRQPYLRAPSEADWVDDILTRALGAAAAQQLPKALEKANSKHPERAPGLQQQLAQEVGIAIQGINAKYDIDLALVDLKDQGARNAFTQKVLEAQQWTKVDSSNGRPNNAKPPAWFKSADSILVNALRAVFVPEEVLGGGIRSEAA